MKTIKSYTLGCKVNQYETRYLLEGLYALGYVDYMDDNTDANTDKNTDAGLGTDADTGAVRGPDVCVINTCTVTSDSDNKSRQLIRRVNRQYPGARLIVMGCWASRNADQARAMCLEFGNNSTVITDKGELGHWLAEEGCPSIPVGISHFAERTRAFIKVQDGCKQFCSYCVIPWVRNRLSSRAPDDVKAEIITLYEQGYREFVLTGIHLGFYGQGFSDPTLQNLTLDDLVEQILDLEGDFRLRISSLESHEVTTRLLAMMVENPLRLCPHLHISMQSGSDRILKAMNRPTSAMQYYENCVQAKRFIPDIALTTDVIVGFPGETDEDFNLTRKMIEQIGFCKTHLFRYSQRAGTIAATLPNQIPQSIKHQRIECLEQVEKQTRSRYFQQLIDQQTPARVLMETYRNGLMTGASERYVPVECPGSPEWKGTFVDVKLLKYDPVKDVVLGESLSLR